MAYELANEMVGRKEFNEFQKRLDDKKADWDRGLAEVKAEVKELRELTNAVSKLAQNMENMMKEQERTSGRLDAIERRDGEMWRKLIGYILTALASAVMTFIFTRIRI